MAMSVEMLTYRYGEYVEDSGIITFRNLEYCSAEDIG